MLRVQTMNDLEKPATRAEIGQMRKMTEEALAAGAIGFSTGLYYEPACAAPTEEVIEVCRPLTARQALYCTHMRNEGDDVVKSLDETFRIGRALAVPHPRLWGSFARVLGHYSRGLNLFPLETAVYKMTGLTARTFGLADRGVLKEGFAADITLFDAGEVDEAATFAKPIQAARGFDMVFVNGAAEWKEGKTTGSRPGRGPAREVASSANCLLLRRRDGDRRPVRASGAKIA